MERVKFFSTSDLGCGYNLENLYDKINEYDENKSEYDINEILELYNITLYIDNECFLIKWTEEDINNLKNTCKKIKKTLGIFCKDITDKNIINYFDKIDKKGWFNEDFFVLLEKYNVFDRIPEKVFNELLQQPYVLHLVLQRKKLVSKYSQSVTIAFLQNSQNAELLLDKYELDERRKDIYIPTQLTNDKKERLIMNM